MNFLRRITTRKRVAVGAVLLGGLGSAAAVAATSSGPPAPAITAQPANPTNATSASFSFTDTQNKVGFLCSLDGSTFSACTSSKTYTGLAAGSHTFAVEATSSSGTSSATSDTWTIDTTAPSAAAAFPANGGTYNASGWSAGCGSAGTGICGSASDASGIERVSISIQQSSTGKYWSGSKFNGNSDSYSAATVSPSGTNATWFYGLPLSPDDTYTIHVLATDNAGNTPSSPAVSTYTINTSGVAQPSFTSTPANPTTSTSASFAFTDSTPGATFQCQLDNAKAQACSSPVSYSSLSANSHTFLVTALNSAGTSSPAATYSWQIVQETSKSISITGSVPAPLYPGAAAQPISVTFVNPNNQTVYVTGLTTTLQSTAPTTCGTANFTITPSTISSASMVTVPANGTTTITTAASGSPLIQMIDTGSNQDICKNATVSFTFTSSGQS